LVFAADLGGAKASVLVNLFTICPRYGRWLADHDQILPLDDGHLMALGTQFRKQVPNEERRDTDSTDPPLPAAPPGVAPDPIAEKEKTKKREKTERFLSFPLSVGGSNVGRQS
jgi:hypothetical protein